MKRRKRRKPMISDYGARRCPCCGSSADRSTPEVRSEPAAEERSFESLQRLWYGFFSDKVFFTYHRCTGCGMLYSPTYFSEGQLEVLYASMPANMAEVEPGSIERTQYGYFRALSGESKAGGDFLEIGPDAGIFAGYCVSAGKFERAWMFEPNLNAHGELRQRLGALPSEISTSLTDLSRVPDASVSVAAMIHVLDHLVEPVPFLQALRPKMRPDGTLIIVTHDERSLLARILGSRWPAYCLQHPHLFNPASMRSMLSSGGFGLTKTVASVNYFPVKFLLKQLALAIKLQLPELPGPRFELPLKLGNFITLARPAAPES